MGSYLNFSPQLISDLILVEILFPCVDSNKVLQRFVDLDLQILVGRLKRRRNIKVQWVVEKDLRIWKHTKEECIKLSSSSGLLSTLFSRWLDEQH